jgi:alpha-glucosidase
MQGQDTATAAAAAWWRGAVIYQVYPRSFRDADGNGVGDLRGVLEGLDHIASLGVDALWLGPVYPSPQRDFGYDVAELTGVDPLFGTLADMDRLIAAAHARGLRVMMDLVIGHTSDQHPWFAESRRSREGERADWYVWADPAPDGTPPNNWLSVFGGAAWSWEPRRRQYYLHHFLASQPTLNLANPAVVEAVEAAARFWLDRGVDGFRLDAVDFWSRDAALRSNPALPPADGKLPSKPFGLQRHSHDMMGPETLPLMARLRALAELYPGTALLGEISSQPGALERISRYTAGEGRLLHMAYTLGPLRGGFDYAAVSALLDAAAMPEGWPCWSFSNHDVVRAATRWAPGGVADPRLTRLLLTLLLTLRGSACLYQGEELGLPEAELPFEALRDPFGLAYWPDFRGRDGSRTPFPWREDTPHAGFGKAEPWLPVPEAHRPLALSAQERDPGSILHHARALLALRQAHPALRTGRLERLDLPAPLIGFDRVLDGQRVRVVLNLSAGPFTAAGWALEPWGAVVVPLADRRATLAA